jgi:hypothetical protein
MGTSGTCGPQDNQNKNKDKDMQKPGQATPGKTGTDKNQDESRNV